MNRRHFLHTLSASALCVGSGTLFAAPAAQSRLLVVFLRGAYDAASLLVPTSSSFYYESRPNIAIARPDGTPDSAIALDSNWALHPALRESLFPLYQAGQAAFIPFAGTNDTSRSHFETQDAIELGQADQRTGRNYRSGFMNRLAAELNGAVPIGFTDQLPLTLQGSVLVPNVSLRSVGKSNLDARQSSMIASMYRGSALAGRVNEGFAVRDEVAAQMADEMTAASRNAINAKGFELQARRIARLMKEKYNIGFVDVGGWDTHVGQGNAKGYLATRLEELGRGLAAFPSEMGDAWRNTVVVVVSEFGRTFRENGNRGTDHGHGTVYWVMGGGVRGGRIAGEQVPVRPESLFQNRDYPVLNEYRAVLGGLFGRMYGLSTARLEAVFPGAATRDVGLV
ncbi:MAG: hypothetical protein JWR21_1709 [Herminiimonas sp.]|nr:hypothetical protein [Herminiimonas sp.]MDB5853624.1 hypothetical protein [Herminiimonas sp.]